MTRIRNLALCALLVVLAGPSLAQTQLRVRGTLTAIDGNMLTVKSREGDDMKVRMTDNVVVIGIAKSAMSEIKTGSYIGVSAMPQPDGSQKALEVHIFPEQMRGTGEGHRPFAPVPNGTMTNGAVSTPMVTGVDGHTIVVRYREGEQKIVIPPGVPIVRYELGGKGDLKPGARFTVNAPVRKADGAIEVPRINVGRDGVVPQ